MASVGCRREPPRLGAVRRVVDFDDKLELTKFLVELTCSDVTLSYRGTPADVVQGYVLEFQHPPPVVLF